MSNHPTSLLSGTPPVVTEPLAAEPDMRSQWRSLGAFMARPALPGARVNSGAMLVLARIFALDILAMLALVVAAVIAVAAGLYIPETALAGIEFTPVVIMMVVLAAPVLEELLFRGWLSGKPGHVLALLLLVGGAAGFWFVHQIYPALGFGLVIAGIAGALACLVFLRHRVAMPWFAALFPMFFWLSATIFALVHILNFDRSGSLSSQLILLPLVLPQFILGVLCGYVRVQIGLWAAMLLHAAHNAFALGLAGLSMLAGG